MITPETIQPEHFDYEEKDGVATIRLNRPERLNALTFDSYAELRDTFRALGERDSVRSVLLTGTGRAFCSGGDVLDIIGKLFGVPDSALVAFTRMTCDLIESIDGRGVKNPSEVQLAVDRGRVNQPLQVRVQRGGRSQDLTVRPAELPREG